MCPEALEAPGSLRPQGTNPACLGSDSAAGSYQVTIADYTVVLQDILFAVIKLFKYSMPQTLRTFSNQATRSSSGVFNVKFATLKSSCHFCMQYL